ncbi:MAG: hypothetical protein O2944_06405 [Proteobacteria bacterium]|nr:hypothetical protein [Pseudomonadota bacterium]
MPSDTQTGDPCKDSVQAALAVMAANISALNARDEKAFAETLHFPHFRLSGGRMKIWETPDDYFTDFKARAGGDWHHSTFEDIRVVQAGADKIHLDVQVGRFGENDQLLTRFRSLWVIARIDGKWAAQLRSTFAEDSGQKTVPEGIGADAGRPRARG